MGVPKPVISKNNTKTDKVVEAVHSQLNFDYIAEATTFRKIFYVLDFVLLSLLYLFVGIGSSSFINKRICTEIDRGHTKFLIFLEATFESLIIVVFLIAILFFVPQVPSIVPNPHPHHLILLDRAVDIILSFATVFGHEKILHKYDFLMGNTE
jgi:hypothetical protein